MSCCNGAVNRPSDRQDARRGVDSGNPHLLVVDANNIVHSKRSHALHNNLSCSGCHCGTEEADDGFVHKQCVCNGGSLEPEIVNATLEAITVAIKSAICGVDDR